MKRTVEPELLDTDAGTPEEVAGSLADLRAINRRFGGIATLRALLLRAAPTEQRELSLLDVASGSADIPQALQQELSARGRQLHVVAMDRSRAHLNGSAAGRPFAAITGDALNLPFRDGSFDFVSCSLFLHHLEPGEIVRFVQEGLRVCRRAVLVSDLRRSRTHLALVYLGFPLYHSRLTRHDAPTSVRRAYTMPEVRELLERAGVTRMEIEPHYLFRMGAIAWKP